MNSIEKKGIVTKIIDREKIIVRVINEDETRLIKGDEFYIKELKDIYDDEESESEGIVMVKFNDETNTIIEELNEGDF